MSKKKVLILSYFFPPCNLPASQRSYGWATQLHEYGYHPIIITRNWDLEVKLPMDLHTSSGIEILHRKHANFEEYILPYKSNLRDRLYVRGKLKIFRKLLSSIEIFFQKYFSSLLPYSSMYDFAKKYLQKNKDVTIVIATANPFSMFKFAYDLKKEFPHINWIADYRDYWNEQQWVQWYNKIPFIGNWLKEIESKYELKCVSNAAAVITISDYYAQNISSFLKKESHSIMNGFNEGDFQNSANNKLFPEFTITYAGTIFPHHNINIFLDGFKKVIDERKSKMKIRVAFLGTLFEETEARRIQKCMVGYEENLLITGRMNRVEVIEFQSKSHLLLLIAFADVKGSPGTKIFDYLGLKKPVMLCPSDNDIMESILVQTNQALVANTSIDVTEKLNEMIDNYIANENFELDINNDARKSYTRQIQTKKLAQILDTFN